MSNEEEIWKRLSDTSLYEASSTGKIRNFKTKKVLKPKTNQAGYLVVSLYKVSCFVHRLVAETFLKNEKNLPQVNHKNGIKTDNSVKNLEWCSASYNRFHAIEIGIITKIAEAHHCAKLKNSDIIKIRDLSKTLTQTQIAKNFGVSTSTISRIINKKNWKSV